MRYLLLCFMLFSHFIHAQQPVTTTYYDIQWNKVASMEKAIYFRESYRKNDTVFVTDYYKSGTIMLTGSFSDKNCNVRNGCFVNYNDQGVKTSVNYFKAGKRTGTWNYWNQKGTLIESMSFSNDVLDGTYLTYTSTGKISSEAVYAKGIRKSFNSYESEAHNPESMPEFPGGNDSLISFISHTIHYPDSARKKSIEGRVILQFVINEKGSITDLTILKSVEKTLDEEALRVVRLMPLWKPALLDEKPVPVRFSLPIMFKLN